MTADLLVEIKDPEVQAALEMLSKRGLGVTVLHQHDDSTDVMTSLEDDMVQFEDDLRVSFVAADDPVLDGSTAVTATWNGRGPVVVGRCRQGHTGPTPPPRS